MQELPLEKRFCALVESARYDVSCASSGSSRKNPPGKLGNTTNIGVCHSWSEDGRCISLLKLLQTNRCVYNCAYCINRSSNDILRTSLTPQEIADITINFYKRNYIEGLFLSSAVYRTPDYSTELMLKTVELLRNGRGFNGYIHVKGIPGTDEKLVRRLGFMVDRLSYNIELPTARSLALLAPQKNKMMLVGAMKKLAGQIDEVKRTRRYAKGTSPYLPAGQSTQMIVGASGESDRTIVTLSEALYRKFAMRRVYYSAYVPVGEKKLLPVAEPPLLREHRLYQADWLIRFYGFRAEELLSEERPDFDQRLDPKTFWAINNLSYFPVEINRAGLEELMRVPGIGVLSAQRIVASRKFTTLDFPELKRIGVVLRRARYFVTCKGRFMDARDCNYDVLPSKMIMLAGPEKKHIRSDGGAVQLPLFAEEPESPEKSLLSLIAQ